MEALSAPLTSCGGIHCFSAKFPHKGFIMQSLDVYFVFWLRKFLSKQPWRTPWSKAIWRNIHIVCASLIFGAWCLPITLRVPPLPLVLPWRTLVKHWGQNCMEGTLQTAFSNVFSWMKNCCILIEILMKFVPKGPISNIPALVQVMAWCWSSNKPLSESMMG